MPGITNRSRKAKKTLATMSLSECMADCYSTVIKGMIALAGAAILIYMGMAVALIITAVRLAG